MPTLQLFRTYKVSNILITELMARGFEQQHIMYKEFIYTFWGGGSHSLPNPAFLWNLKLETKFEQEYVRCVRNEKECL